MCWIFNEISNGSIIRPTGLGSNRIVQLVESEDGSDDSEEEFRYGEAIEYVSLGCVIKRD